ncbi:hypothetical protein JR316_0011167 [Psilocybe cubensis]|uniref:Uncharacterized protein n=1 Tax=Psilocybe cubensis TaxID=181762 RepID=A0ACB8GNM3_PSICU|nr:hypothetical protein JR316_0011167 [Psilocybe cubensis]KAH9477248.1 hypothetical protein JR316_0011167 [Psilocybe cubensis]
MNVFLRRIQNVAGGTYLDLVNGWCAPGTQVHGWVGYATESQDWFLRRMSRTDGDLIDILAKDTHNASNFQGFRQDSLTLEFCGE